MGGLVFFPLCGFLILVGLLGSCLSEVLPKKWILRVRLFYLASVPLMFAVAIAPAPRIMWWCLDRMEIIALKHGSAVTRAKAARSLGKNPWERNSKVIASLVKAFNDPDPLVRTSAAESIHDLGRGSDYPDRYAGLKQAIEPLIHLLDDQVPEVRASAIRALGRIGQTQTMNRHQPNPEHLEYMLRSLDDPSPEVQLAAARALMGTQEPSIVARIIRLHKESSEPDMLKGTAWVLGSTKNPEVVEVLLETLESSSVSSVRSTVISALGVIGDPKVKFVLERILQSESNKSVRNAATRVLEQLEPME